MFARVFLSFWVAIVLIAAAAVALTALNYASDHRNYAVVTRDAAEALENGGIEGLRTWLAERNSLHTRQRTFIIDHTGNDILGQPLPHRRLRGLKGKGLEGRARHVAPSGPAWSRQTERHMLAQWRKHMRRLPGSIIRADDGTAYFVLIDPPPRHGPFSPPFTLPVRIGFFLLALAISGLVSYWLARSITKPLQRLQATARTLSTGKLDERTAPVVSGRRDEIGALARELDSMADRLNAMVEARHQLLRDISHELRSPLARLQMALGLARQDPAASPEQLDRIERETERLERLIGNILDYARLERDASTLTIESIDLVELVRQIVHDTQFEMQIPRERLGFTHPDALVLDADAQVLHAAIDNVVRNAFIHGGTSAGQDAPFVTVTLEVEPDKARITVRDNGPGVPEADLSHIFEPFYRVARRSTDRATRNGAGIGLAVTARAVALHGGRVSARNAEAGGLIVTIDIPLRSRGG